MLPMKFGQYEHFPKNQRQKSNRCRESDLKSSWDVDNLYHVCLKLQVLPKKMMRGTAARSNVLLNVPHEHSRLFLNSPNDLSDFQRCSGSYFAAAVSRFFFIPECSLGQEMFSSPFYSVFRWFLSYCREMSPKFPPSQYQGTSLELKLHDYFPFLFT